jgi:hypothetical protein
VRRFHCIAINADFQAGIGSATRHFRYSSWVNCTDTRAHHNIAGFCGPELQMQREGRGEQKARGQLR